VQVASFLGVLVGGAWADRWSGSNPRARAYVTAIGFGAAAPALFLTGTSSVLIFAILGLILFGLGRGFYDANLMPILRQVIDERYSATGYGILNCVGCLIGGGITYAGGALRDAKVPFGIVFQAGAVGLGITCVLLFLLRPRQPARSPDLLKITQVD
jgi:MFS family permease